MANPVTFTPPAREFPGIQIATPPAMATFPVETRLWIAFPANNPNLLFPPLSLMSSPDGVNFTTPEPIPQAELPLGSAPAMAAFNNRLFIVFQDTLGPGLFFTSSPDGVNFAAIGRIVAGSPSSIGGDGPAIAAFNNRLFVAFNEGRSNSLLLASSADGVNFTTPEPFDPPIPIGSSPAMTVFKNRLFIAFQSNDPSHILFVTSSADGVNFTNPARGFPGIQLGSAPAMTALGGRLYILFQANDPGHALSVTSSTDGVNFTTPTANPGILIGSAPASGEFDQRLWAAFQANDASDSLFLAVSSPV
jgi:hypothetical protein